MNRLLLVAAFGIVGTLARLGLADSLPRVTPHSLPWGTLIANLAGSLLLGALYALPSDALPHVWRTAIGVGCLGALTTFSTLMWETTQIWSDGAPLRASGYLAGSIALGLVGVTLGAALSRAAG